MDLMHTLETTADAIRNRAAETKEDSRPYTWEMRRDTPFVRAVPWPQCKICKAWATEGVRTDAAYGKHPVRAVRLPQGREMPQGWAEYTGRPVAVYTCGTEGCDWWRTK